MPKKPTGLKSALELAMERLEGDGAEAPKLSAAQKTRIKEIEQRYEAKIAERKITLESEIRAAVMANELERAQELQQALMTEPAELRQKMEAEKQKVWEEREQ